MFVDASVLFDWLMQLDDSAAGRLAAAIVLVLAVIGSWGTFSGGGDVADVDQPMGG